MRQAGIGSAKGSIRALLMSSVLAASLSALSSPTTSLPAAARNSSPSAAPANNQARPLLLRRVSDTPSFGAHRLVMLKRVADNTPTARLATGWKVTKNTKARVYPARTAPGGLQCVPFARAVSGIELKGNAVHWWDAAAGVYARGSHPEPGAVLNFRANGTMPLGHVAVVKRVINSREIEIDHANWSYSGKGNVSRDVSVIDVSARNDWSAVRVELGRSGDFGSIYATYGFIYDRPDQGTIVANSRPMTNVPHGTRDYEEVAEAPYQGATSIADAPVRSLR